MKAFGLAAALVALVALAGCGRAVEQTAMGGTPQERLARSINDARFSSSRLAPSTQAATAAPYDPLLLKLQVLLDRARFSPGAIDGKNSDNLRGALRAFEQANNLPVDGVLDRELWSRLTGGDSRPVMRTYVIDPSDVAGPFQFIPGDLEAMSRLDSLSYASPAESLAESFHMDVALLVALNPGIDFGKAGTTILVADRGSDDLGVDVALVEVAVGGRQVRAFGADRRLLAAYPATMGSQRRPMKGGVFKVDTVAASPTYLAETDEAALGVGLNRRRLELAPGPNNPMGPVAIELSEEGLSLHGTPEPGDVGKPASRGSVRMTNWDVRELARGVREGTPVIVR